MKKIIFTLMMAIVALGAMAAEPVMAWFTVEPPMTCENCENKIKSNLRFEKGVKEIKPSAADAVVCVAYDPSATTVEKLIEGFKKIGYTATQVEAPAAESAAPAKKHCGKGCAGCPNGAKKTACPAPARPERPSCPEKKDCGGKTACPEKKTCE